MDLFLAIGLMLSAAGLVQGGLMLVHAWEHRRYHRSRLTAELKLTAPLRVTLFVPCKGVDVGMEGNLQALFEQQYGPLELCFLVESEREPATDVIRTLASRFPRVACRTVYTGTARDCGQKVHNLSQGTLAVPSDTEVLAFVDSDACPHRDWLARLVERLRTGKSAVATGYRWYVPVRPTMANRLLSAINNTVIGVMGPHGFNLVWGGAWAMRAEVFRRIGLPAAWRGTLSDDLVVSRLVHDAKLKVAYEPHALVRSAADFAWRGLAEFLRRQYIVARVYAPRWWGFAVLSAALSNLIIWGSAGLTIGSGLAGRLWQWPLLALAGFYLLTAFRGALAARAVRPFVDVSDETYGSVARINVWCWPIVSLVIGLGLAASSMSRTIVWRGIRYRLDSPHRTTILQLGEKDKHTRNLLANSSQRAA